MFVPINSHITVYASLKAKNKFLNCSTKFNYLKSKVNKYYKSKKIKSLIYDAGNLHKFQYF